jgi:uncharacterized membrane protein
MTKLHHVAERLLGASFESLDVSAQEVARRVSERKHIARNLSTQMPPTTFGQRAADAVAGFGGSWKFIFIFFATLASWVILNSVVLVRRDEVFDAYPYILLNLFLSMLASIQAPLILMSQNRQSEKDRASAAHDYEINLKAELEIMLLHEKMDSLRDVQWAELIAFQQQQIELLRQLMRDRQPPH